MKNILLGLSLFATVWAIEQTLGKPNFIFIMMDDMGYGDVGCFGSEKNRTPAMDQLAEQGAKFTSFYTQPVCGPTRAAILTGSYTMRVAEFGNEKRHHPMLHPKEILIPRVLKAAGYTSACIGKWDLNRGAGKEWPLLMPNDFGFDYSYGRPRGAKGENFENGKQIEQVPQELLTKDLTDRSLRFIEENKDKPFFLYLAHPMPHEPIAASDQFRGKSKNGLYGDVIEELDWNIGRVVDKVDELGLQNNTLIIVTSDNGPWPHWTGPEESGETGPLRGQKTETWEGGVRVPFIIRAPGIIPAGIVRDGMIGDVDMLPTIAAWAGVQAPVDRIIDGKNLVPYLTGETHETPVTERYFYYDSHLQAVRSGKWKLILPRPFQPPWLKDKGMAKNWRGRDVGEISEPELYDLDSDIGETTDLADRNPKIVKKLLALAEKARSDLGDYNQIGSGARFFDKGPQREAEAQWRSQK